MKPYKVSRGSSQGPRADGCRGGWIRVAWINHGHRLDGDDFGDAFGGDLGDAFGGDLGGDPGDAFAPGEWIHP